MFDNWLTINNVLVFILHIKGAQYLVSLHFSYKDVGHFQLTKCLYPKHDIVSSRAHERGYSDTRHCQNFSSDTRHSGKKMPDTDTQNSPRHSTPTFQKMKIAKNFSKIFRAFGAISYLE